MVHGGRHQAEGGKTIDNELAFGERLMWKEVGHMANDKWMMRRKVDHVDQRVETGG
jgi:hypothetical protein